jgi:SRSO17 transposase
MAWRTAGNVGRGGGPLILFFPPCCFKPAILEESVGDHRHERPLAQAVSGSVGSQGTATNVPVLRVGTDRSWRSQEHSADGEAACDQLHHFIADGVWDATPVETELLIQADRLVGGDDAVLVIDDTAIPKKGTHSVGVAAQYASALGKTANCQTLVSLTLARGEVPVMLGLRLFLPESWTSNQARLKRAGVPTEYRTARTKPELALAEIDRVIATGVRFGCVLADAGYGLSAPFRQGARRSRRTATSRAFRRTFY